MARAGPIVAAVVAVAALALLVMAAIGGVGLTEGALILVMFGLVLGLFAVTVAAAIHALVRADLTGVQRIVWIAIVVFVPFAAIVYFALGRARTAALFRDVGAPASQS